MTFSDKQDGKKWQIPRQGRLISAWASGSILGGTALCWIS